LSGEKETAVRHIVVSVIKYLLLATIFHSFATNALAADWALSGTVVTPTSVIPNGTVAITDATILAVGPSAEIPASATAIKVNGIILPGFVDLHNHLSWNVLPRWIPAHKFSNRYEWQDTAEYDRVLVTPHNATLDAVACETEVYAEIKSLVGGATSSIGSLLPSTQHPDNRKCSAGLVRNLDLWSGLPFSLPDPSKDQCQRDKAHLQLLADLVDNEIFPMEVQHDRLDFLRCELAAGVLRGLVIHLAEGAPTDSSAHREFNMVNQAGLLMPGLGVVHGTALRPDDFAKMNGAGLVWSPRSNDELYGATINVAAAVARNVPIAIAPDWSPSGSAGMLQEIGYAARRYGTFFSADTLIAMATATPAKLARVDSYIGSLAPGLMADLVVIRDNGGPPAQSVVKASPADVMLVVVGGAPIYGDAPILRQLLPPGTKLDTLTVCGAQKSINLAGSFAADSGESVMDIQNKIGAALGRLGSAVPPIECD
jgi:5-methylthioadenosine/S-adenosylhomocysteine deaminase